MLPLLNCITLLAIFFSPSLPVSCFSRTSPHFPALVSLLTLYCSLFECQDYASFYIRWLAPIVRWKKKGLRRGKWAKLLKCQDKWPTRPTRACGINFCCPSLLCLCCQWLFGLLKWPIFSLLRQSTLVIFQSLLSLWHTSQAEIKKVCRSWTFRELGG